MAWHKMKPETIERRGRERAQAVENRRTDAVERLAALVKRDGPDSIWAELLAERTAPEGVR